MDEKILTGEGGPIERWPDTYEAYRRERRVDQLRVDLTRIFDKTILYGTHPIQEQEALRMLPPNIKWDPVEFGARAQEWDRALEGAGFVEWIASEVPDGVLEAIEPAFMTAWRCSRDLYTAVRDGVSNQRLQCYSVTILLLENAESFSDIGVQFVRDLGFGLADLPYVMGALFSGNWRQVKHWGNEFAKVRADTVRSKSEHNSDGVTLSNGRRDHTTGMVSILSSITEKDAGAASSVDRLMGRTHRWLYLIDATKDVDWDEVARNSPKAKLTPAQIVFLKAFCAGAANSSSHPTPYRAVTDADRKAPYLVRAIKKQLEHAVVNVPSGMSDANLGCVKAGDSWWLKDLTPLLRLAEWPRAEN